MSSRSSSRVTKKPAAKDFSKEISTKLASEIGEASLGGPEAFLEAFDGLSGKNLESFVRSLSPSQSLSWWPIWSSFFDDATCSSDALPIYIQLLRSSSALEADPIEPIKDFMPRIVPLLSSEEVHESLKSSISLLCDKFLKHVPGNDTDFRAHLLSYLLQKNTGDHFSGATAKRITAGLTSASEDLYTRLKPLFPLAIGEPKYYLNKESVKTLSLIVAKSSHFGKQIHDMTKRLLPGIPLESALSLGGLYKTIWLKSEPKEQESFQDNCIQDLMYYGVMGNRALPPEASIVPQIRRLLDPFHHDKSHKGLQAMLYNLWEPILWRNLKSPLPSVRCNAAELLFEAFPCENPHLNLEDRALAHETQVKVMKDLLIDTEPSVRLIAVKGVCQALASYWSFLTSDSIADLLGILIRRSSRDGESVQVRISLLQGLGEILKDAPASHAYMKEALPRIGDSLLDVKEGVRLAMLDLLSIVKGVKYITYWEICPLEDLLHRLAEDSSPAVCKRLVRLLFNSFFPAKEPESVKLERCIFLIEKNSVAAIRFYEHSQKYMKLMDAVKFILCILVSFKRHLKATHRDDDDDENDIPLLDTDDSCSDKENSAVDQPGGGEEEDSQESTAIAEASQNAEEFDSFVSNPNIMDYFLDIITVMWISRYEELIQKENESLLAVLEKKTTKIMTNMFRIYKGTDMARKIIYICSLFSQSSANTIVRHCLHNLRRNDKSQDFEIQNRQPSRTHVIQSWRGHLEDPKETQEYSIFIDALCNWKKGTELLEFIYYGVQRGLEQLGKPNPSESPPPKRRKSVRFMEEDPNLRFRSLHFLSYIFRHSINKQRVLTKNLKELQEVTSELSKIKAVLKTELLHPTFNEEEDNMEYIYLVWETYLKSALIIEERSCIETLAMEGLQLMELVEKSTSKLRLPLLKAFILFLSNGFTLSKFQEPEGDLLKALLVLLPSWAAADDSEAPYLCLSLLGEVFEWSLYLSKAASLDLLHSDLMAAAKALISDLKAASLSEAGVLQDFKSCLSALLVSLQLYSSSSNSFFALLRGMSDVILEELSSELCKEVELPKICSLKDLPGLSSLLSGSLYPKSMKYFLEELRLSLQLKSLKDSELAACLVYLHSLTLDEDLNISKASLRDCLSQLEEVSLPDSMPDAPNMIHTIKSKLAL